MVDVQWCVLGETEAGKEGRGMFPGGWGGVFCFGVTRAVETKSSLREEGHKIPFCDSLRNVNDLPSTKIDLKKTNRPSHSPRNTRQLPHNSRPSHSSLKGSHAPPYTHVPIPSLLNPSSSPPLRSATCLSYASQSGSSPSKYP